MRWQRQNITTRLGKWAYMAKKSKATYSWTGEIDGKTYHMKYEEPFLWVNGSPKKVKACDAGSYALALNEEFSFDGHTARFAARPGGTFDIVFRGAFLSDGEPYRKVEGWAATLARFSAHLAFGVLGTRVSTLAADAIVKLSQTTAPFLLRLAVCLLIVGAQLAIRIGLVVWILSLK